MTPRGLAGASQSYKERRDLMKMKSSGKVRESITEDPAKIQQQSVTNYSEIINRIEQNLVAPKSNPNINVSASKQIAEASGESDEKDPEFNRRNHIDEDNLEESKDHGLLEEHK